MALLGLVLLFNAPGVGSSPVWAQEILHSNSDPTFTPAYTEARVLLARKAWPEAAVVLRKLINRAEGKDGGRIDPTLAIDLSKALFYSNRREEALSLLGEAATQSKGKTRERLISRQRVLSRTFMTQAAFQVFQEGLNLLRAKRYTSARERMDKVLEQEPQNVDVITRIAQCLVLEGDFDSAAEKLRLAKKLNPYEPEIHLWLGRALYHRGEAQVAYDELKFAQTRLPLSEAAQIWLSDVHVMMGNRQAAIQLLEKNAKANPLQVDALLNLVQLKFGAGVKDRTLLWQLRRDVQVAESRFADYVSAPLQSAEPDDLSLDLRNTEKLKTQLDEIQSKIEARLNAQPGVEDAT